jgi:hypothetical protein
VSGRGVAPNRFRNPLTVIIGHGSTRVAVSARCRRMTPGCHRRPGIAAIRDVMLRYDGLAGLVGVLDRRPDLLADAWHAVHAYTGDDQHRAWGLQSLTFTRGQGACPGVAVGRMATTADKAARMSADGPIILVRPHTSRPTCTVWRPRRES